MAIAPGFLKIVRREVRRLCSRPIYLVGMIAVPLCMALFFVSLMSEGLPKEVPSAIVDLDGSQVSKRVAHSLNAMELVSITRECESFNEAMDAVQRGEVYGFFVIPRNFARDAQGGRTTTITFYSNLTYYVPGTLEYKGFKTLAITAKGGLVERNLVSKGAPEMLAETILQPMTIRSHPIGNPWLNYSYYLSTSFLPAILELMIFLMTTFSVMQELKNKTSVEWLQLAHGNVWSALAGKLAPQTVIFTLIGVAYNSLMFGWLHFPMNGSLGWLLVGMFLFVVASQSFALIVCCAIPNPRLSLSICSLTGILAFSIAAFSYPVEQMYGGIAIFSYILPIRWYFLIYIDLALNGMPLYYARVCYAALLCFPIMATLMAPLLRRSLRRPIYVP